MSYKISQLFPPVSTRISDPLLLSEDMSFLQSWFEGGSIGDESTERRHINWGAIAGLALSVALSATFWAGVVWIVAHVWR